MVEAQVGVDDLGPCLLQVPQLPAPVMLIVGLSAAASMKLVSGMWRAQHEPFRSNGEPQNLHLVEFLLTHAELAALSPSCSAR